MSWKDVLIVLAFCALALSLAGALIVWPLVHFGSERRDKVIGQCGSEGGIGEPIGRYRVMCLTPDGRVKWVKEY